MKRRRRINHLLPVYLDLQSQWTPHKGKKKLKKNYQKCPRQRKVKMMRLEHINLRLEETMATGGGMTEDMIVTGETTGEDMTEGMIVMTEDMIEEMTEEDTTDGGMIEDMIGTDGTTEVDTTGEMTEDHPPDMIETGETIEVIEMIEMRVGTAMKRQRRRRSERKLQNLR